MRKILVITLPLLLSACGNATTYQQECASKHDKFAPFLTCTKDKLYNDPRAGVKGAPSYTAELLTYGEQLNSQVRQQLVTDKQAKELFAQRVVQYQEREAAMTPVQNPPVAR